MNTVSDDRVPPDDRLIPQARRRVALKMGFFMHALVFALVNVGLFVIHAATGAGRGVHLPFWGWAIGLGAHGAVVFLELQAHGLRDWLLTREIKSLKG